MLLVRAVFSTALLHFMLRATLRCLFFLTLAPFSIAAESIGLSRVLEQAEFLELAEHPTWLKLLHYEPGIFSMTSAIHSPEFFLAKDGKENPRSELLSTLKAFFADINGDENKHAQCVFFARFIWLKSVLPLEQEHLPNPVCDEYLTWSLAGSVDSISLVYASGYLSNPASFYGHTLIKFNTHSDNQSRLLDATINYGAIVPDHENPISYIIKGLTGGYGAGFSHINYHFHTHNYTETELRDLWEYELAFSYEETQFLIAHLWELLGKEYTYYFLNKNCAYRMAELFELIDGVELVADSSPWVIPQDIFRHIARTDYDNKPLLRSVNFLPSRRSRFYQKYYALSQEERNFFSRIVLQPETLDHDRFHNAKTQTKYRLLDALIDYYQSIKKTT